MWSARTPVRTVRHTIFPVAKSIATTSLKLGRDTYSVRPSLEA
jgi:hypothetical protein